MYFGFVVYVCYSLCTKETLRIEINCYVVKGDIIEVCLVSVWLVCLLLLRPVVSKPWVEIRKLLPGLLLNRERQ